LTKWVHYSRLQCQRCETALEISPHKFLIAVDARYTFFVKNVTLNTTKTQRP
jgi:hypothetical protein